MGSWSVYPKPSYCLDTYQTHTLFDIHVNSNNIFPADKNECRAHPSWAPTKEPTVSCWRYTPTPKQDRFQDLLEAI